ncbi:serine/threonine-protein phosphatase 6 regulatory ankyrin repeat subunit B-like isoform X2 [Centruroides sculpturatus]|nr:serine/threonine-protein phosphatase 6 regulatory ankyrin repeat subunit B-like isoform X2 [Centruroides sculpturatus]
MTSPTTLASTAFTSNLPPVRSVRQMPLPLMASVSDDPISLWLKLGALEKLEQVVLDGYGDQLYGKTSRIPQVNKFLRQIPVFQNKIDEIHRAVSQGKLREIQHLIDRKKLAFCRDQMGASPLHKAVLFKQKEIMTYLITHYGSIIHTRDHQGRTPLHYAAVLQDNGEIFNMLLEAGADIRATDMYGRRPEHYMQSQEGFTLQDLKASSTAAIKRKQKHTLPKHHHKKHTSKNKSHIQEIIDEGNLEKLEELVLQGKGDKLFGETSANKLVQDFLDKVPSYMERIQSIHKAVVRGNLRDVKSLLDRKNLAITRDPTGATPLHKAIIYGHHEIAKYIAQNFPSSRDAVDGDGRTALHYAAVLKDNNEMYNMLTAIGARSSILDSKGKTPEYYLQHPEQINMDYVLKNNQRANATYIANTASRLKLKVPSSQLNKPSDNSKSTEEKGDYFDVDLDDQVNAGNHFESNLPLYKRGIVLRNKPVNPPKPKRIEVTSANIHKWISSEDIQKLEDAVLEGYGDKIAKQTAENEEIQNFINTNVPKLLEKIEAIHSAVSNDDLSGLQDYLDKDDFALAKDHLGMTPLHRAVLFNRTNILQFLINKFPETVNARDKEGRTPLHYAASVAQKDKMRSYRLLLQAGGDPKIRDNQGRTPEYYRTHHVAIPSKAEIKSRTKQSRRTTSEPPAASRNKLGGEFKIFIFINVRK